MKKPVLQWILIPVIALLLIFSLQSSVWAEKIDLKFFHAMGHHREKVLNELISRFNKQNPDINVVGIRVKSRDPRMGNDYHALYKTILESLARKNPPDISQVYENWTVQLLDIGAIVPLEKYVGNEISQQSLDDLVPIFREANTFDGKLCTLPFNKSIYVLYYNKDAFKKAGVKPPKTWEDFRKVAKKLTIRKDDQVLRYGIAFRPSVDIFGHYLYAHGGDFIEGDRAAFDGPVGVNDLKFWVDMVHMDRSALASFSDRKEFSSGNSAMYIDTTSRISRFEGKLDFDWGVALLPRGTTRRYQFAGTNLAVFSHLSEKKRKAAIKFVKYMASPDATIYWSINTGYLPVRKSAINSPRYQQFINSHPRYKVGIESLKYAVVQPKVAAWEMIRGIVDDAMFEAMSLRNAPEVALERAARMSNHLMSSISGKK